LLGSCVKAADENSVATEIVAMMKVRTMDFSVRKASGTSLRYPQAVGSLIRGCGRIG
jgi:hypothetical protein